MIVKPAPGLKVRKPDGTHLAEDGEEVTDTPYWRRRLADGSVAAAEVAAAPKSKK